MKYFVICSFADPSVALYEGSVISTLTDRFEDTTVESAEIFEQVLRTEIAALNATAADRKPLTLRKEEYDSQEFAAPITVYWIDMLLSFYLTEIRGELQEVKV